MAIFDKRFGLPPLSLRVIQPGAVPRYGPPAARTGAAGETTLDVEWAHTVAPGAKILLVETPAAEIEGRSGFPQIIKAEKYVIRHHLATVISQSFGATEPTFQSRAAIRALRGAYLLAARPAYRVTVVASTGDSGAAGQTYSTRSYFTTPEVSWPASDPMVTAVGGTQLAPAGDATPRGPDLAWSGSGGGRSAVFTRPAYQSTVADVVGHHRGIPDISMDASCASAAAIYGNNGGYPAQPSSWSTACGTSLAAPMFAGIVALAAQQAGIRSARSTRRSTGWRPAMPPASWTSCTETTPSPSRATARPTSCRASTPSADTTSSPASARLTPRNSSPNSPRRPG